MTGTAMDSRLTLTVERPVAGGRMLARHEGRVVLVSGAIPGERVVVRLERVTRKVAFAATVAVLDESPDRRAPRCDPACGGAAYAHIGVERQRALKAEVVVDVFRRIGRISLEDAVVVAPSPELAYRLRGRLHVHAGRAGFFHERSHRWCDAAATGQFKDETLPVVAQVVEWLGAGADTCESIQVAENVTASERVLHLEPVPGGRVRHPAGGPLPIAGLTGLTTSAGGRMTLIAGEGRVTDSARVLTGSDLLPDDVTWTRTAASFFQGNRFLTGALLMRVLECARGPRVLDLYAGVGLFSVGLAAQGASVTAVEGDATSVGDLEINATRWASTLNIRQAAVEAALSTMPPAAFDTIVLDPPRTGASPDAIRSVVALGAGRLIYVSCDPATLARDAALLVAGGYRLSSVEAFDLFPNTAHVEMLAVFDR